MRGSGGCESICSPPVVPARAGTHPWLPMPPQPVQEGRNHRGCRESQGWAPDRGPGRRSLPHEHISSGCASDAPDGPVARAFAPPPVVPAKTGTHPWLPMLPQPVQEGRNHRSCRKNQGWAPDRGPGRRSLPHEHISSGCASDAPDGPVARAFAPPPVVPAKTGTHPWLPMLPQPVQEGRNHRSCRKNQGWAPDRGPGRRSGGGACGCPVANSRSTQTGSRPRNAARSGARCGCGGNRGTGRWSGGFRGRARAGG